MMLIHIASYLTIWNNCKIMEKKWPRRDSNPDGSVRAADSKSAVYAIFHHGAVGDKWSGMLAKAPLPTACFYVYS